VIVGSLLAAPLAAEAQQAGKVWRIGCLSPAADRNNPIEDAFYRSMQARARPCQALPGHRGRHPGHGRAHAGARRRGRGVRPRADPALWVAAAQRAAGPGNASHLSWRSTACISGGGICARARLPPAATCWRACWTARTWCCRCAAWRRTAWQDVLARGYEGLSGEGPAVALPRRPHSGAASYRVTVQLVELHAEMIPVPGLRTKGRGAL